MEGLPRVVWMPGGVKTEVHLEGGDTNGAFCLLVDHPPSGWSLPPHLHSGVAETIHVVEGEFEMTVEGGWSRLGPGDTIHVPGDVVHSGGNVGPSTGRRIVLFSPAGMERFFLEVGGITHVEAAASGSRTPANRKPHHPLRDRGLYRASTVSRR